MKVVSNIAAPMKELSHNYSESCMSDTSEDSGMFCTARNTMTSAEYDVDAFNEHKQEDEISNKLMNVEVKLSAFQLY